MQCACAILSSVACLALQYFSLLSHKRHDKKKLLNITGNCVQGQEISDYVPQEFIVHLGSSRRTVLYDKPYRRLSKEIRVLHYNDLCVLVGLSGSVKTV